MSRQKPWKYPSCRNNSVGTTSTCSVDVEFTRVIRGKVGSGQWARWAESGDACDELLFGQFTMDVFDIFLTRLYVHSSPFLVERQTDFLFDLGERFAVGN